MSDYYDLFLSLKLKPGLPNEIMHEIRWHLRLTDEPPAHFHSPAFTDGYGDTPYPLFTGTEQSHAFDGVDVTAMVPATNRMYPDEQPHWLLTVRSCVHEDEFGQVMELVGWILARSTADGWVGYLGYTADSVPSWLFYTEGRLRIRKPT